MIVIVFATEMEAKPAINRLKARRIYDDRFPLYSFALGNNGVSGHLIVSGMGKQNAKRAAEYVLEKQESSLVINAGICGALSNNVNRGEIFRIDKVGDGDAEATDELLDVADSRTGDWDDLPGATLLTVSEGVFDCSRRAELAGRGKIVDMEAHPIADACGKRNVPCVLLKGVSDLADGSGRSDIKKNITAVSARLAAILVAGIESLPLSTRRQPREIGHTHIARKLFNFVRFEHTVFSLPLLFSGAWIGAGGQCPQFDIVFLVLLAGVGGRTLGMAVNRIFDRDLDAMNERTRNRELPSGALSIPQAYMVALAGLAVYTTACALLGGICLYLAPIPLIPLIGYSLLKRFTRLCHFGIGLCLALAPLGAFVASSGGVALNAEIVMLSLFTFCWISGYDIIYALQDIESDRENGVHSIPASLGANRAQFVAGGTHLLAAGALIWLWLPGSASLLPLLAVLVAVGALCFSYLQGVPLHVRFFPASAVAGIAGALVPLLGKL